MRPQAGSGFSPSWKYRQIFLSLHVQSPTVISIGIVAFHTRNFLAPPPPNRSRAAFHPRSIFIDIHRCIHYPMGWPFDQINVDKYRLPLNKYRLEGRIYVNLCPLHYAKAIARYRFGRGYDKLRILCLPISVALSDKHRARESNAAGTSVIARMYLFCRQESIPFERGQWAKFACKYTYVRLEHTSKGFTAECQARQACIIFPSLSQRPHWLCSRDARRSSPMIFCHG